MMGIGADDVEKSYSSPSAIVSSVEKGSNCVPALARICDAIISRLLKV